MTRSTGDQLWTGLSGVLCQFAMRVGDAMSHRKADYPVGDDHRNEPEEGKDEELRPRDVHHGQTLLLVHFACGDDIGPHAVHRLSD